MTFQRWTILGVLAFLAMGILTCLGASVCFLLVPDLPATPRPNYTIPLEGVGPTSIDNDFDLETTAPLPPHPTSIPISLPTPVQFNFIDARTMCASFVEDRLKSPSTADFLLETEEAIGVEENGVALPRNNTLVKGQLDAQNDFGATVRMTYVCQLHYDPEYPDQWFLDRIDIK